MTLKSSQNCSSDHYPASVCEEINRLVGRIQGQQGTVAIAESLRAASILIENAAYEMASHDNASDVSRLILTAAGLDRMVAKLENES